MATGTNNPPGSDHPLDLRADAKNLDLLLLAPNDSYPDRLGVLKRSWAGINSAYDSAEDERNLQFQQALAASGFEYPPLVYVDGVPLQVDRSTQTIERAGNIYTVEVPNAFPFVLTGIFATDAPNLVLRNDQTLRQDLAATDGADLVTFEQDGPGSVALTSSIKMGERMSITDKGAIGDGVTNCAQAIIDAASSTAWDIYVPRGDFVATVTSANAAAIFGILNRIKLDGSLTLNIASGTTNLVAPIVINSPDAQKIQILGATPISTTATNQVSVSGSAKAYSVIIGVASSAGAAIGDYAIIRTNVTGTGDFYAHAGMWRITAVDSGGSNRLTLFNTHHGASFPVNTLTGGTVIILKTVLKFTGVDGLRPEGGQSLGLWDGIATVGDWDLVAGTGTLGAHGLVTASPIITGGGSSNSLYNIAGNITLGFNVGFASWGEQGIAISGHCGLVANFTASCSNRKRGWYSEGGHIRCKFAIGSGNGEDGFISDTGGAFIQAALCIASGNGLNGFFNINNGTTAAATSVATGNLASGFECRGLGEISADVAKSMNNGAAGFLATDGGMIGADSATSTGNGAHGFDASTGIIDADNSISTGNTGYGYRGQVGSQIRTSGSTVSGNTIANYLNRESIIIDSAGLSVPQDTPTYSVGQRFYDINKAIYMGIAITSIGDMVLSTNTTGRYVFKADGTQHPNVTNSQDLARVANIYRSTYTRQVFVGSAGAQLISGGAGTPEGVVTAPVGSQWLRSDGGAVTTLYIKETGAGNTGWVAK